MASRNLWELRYDPGVRRELERIRNKAVLRKIEGAARQLRERPFSGKALRGHPGVRSLPITTPGGEYRLLCASGGGVQAAAPAGRLNRCPHASLPD